MDCTQVATAAKKRDSIHSCLGRPPSKEVLGTFPEYVRQAILNIRANHPGWGAKVIHAELSANPKFEGLVLPSIRSIGVLLKAKGLVRAYEKHVAIPNTELCSAQQPHEVWQLDAQGGVKLPNIGPIAMINIKDVVSRVYCMAYPNKKKSIHGYSLRLDYQCALRLAFSEHGLPQRIQTDHEGVFVESKGKSPFPSVFHLWLVGLGVALSFSRIKRPTDQGLVERMHQTIEKQVLQGIMYPNWEKLFDFCQQRRGFLNQHFRCASLDDRSPYQAFPEAKHSGRPYYLQKEEQLIDLNRIYQFLGKGKWYRKVSTLRSLTLGGQVYYVANAKPNTQLYITFDVESKLLHFHNDKEILIQKIPIKGINKERLMGEIFWKMINVQLQLPLYWNTQKISTTFLHNT